VERASRGEDFRNPHQKPRRADLASLVTLQINFSSPQTFLYFTTTTTITIDICKNSQWLPNFLQRSVVCPFDPIDIFYSSSAQITPPSSFSPNSNTTTGVLGCTGSVGQRFILLLAEHPYFTLHAVGASSRSAGKRYKDAVKWKQASPMGKHTEELIVKECKASEFADCDIIFSGLDADVAGEIGKDLIPMLKETRLMGM
jgi:Semialdehyde dehydrogenase, NAD binding domain